MKVFMLFLASGLLMVATVTSQTTECDDDSLRGHCISPNSTSRQECNGRGMCVCGQCECNPRRPHTSETYSGRYCECDDYSCPFHDMKSCSGNGKCVCGKCVCNEGFQGNACECRNDVSRCMAESGKLCNGVGECVCGECRCWTNSSYRGPTCSDCPTCSGGCLGESDCALCKAFHTGGYDNETCAVKCQHVQLVEHLDTNDYSYPRSVRLCRFFDREDANCRIFFTLEYKSATERIVNVQRTKVCKTERTGAGSSNNMAPLMVVYGLVTVALFPIMS